MKFEFYSEICGYDRYRSELIVRTFIEKGNRC